MKQGPRILLSLATLLVLWGANQWAIARENPFEALRERLPDLGYPGEASLLEGSSSFRWIGRRVEGLFRLAEPAGAEVRLAAVRSLVIFDWQVHELDLFGDEVEDGR